mmetsp:Transcript_110766/g.308609  ORF Transcript_110766/g.308609 Transcript_110766/m.308609 type:complete len:234 (+) Transcript_110766:155-856(+)
MPDAPSKQYCCYILLSSSSNRTRTYTGITDNLGRRVRKHNGEIKGGARATRTGRPWRVLCVVRGFPCKGDALCFEWRAKRERAVHSKKLVPVRGGLERRCANIYDVLFLDRWTEKCRRSSEIPLTLTWYGGAPRGRRRRMPAHIREVIVASDFDAHEELARVRPPKRRRLRGSSEGVGAAQEVISQPIELDGSSSSSISSSSSSSGSSSASSSACPTTTLAASQEEAHTGVAA